MDKISDAIKCFNCMNILSTPIFLPCGHSICKAHSDVPDKELICSRCGVSHPYNGFVVNLGLLDLINSQLSSLDFGSSHKEAKQACDKLDDVLLQISHILKDPSDYGYTVIDEMRKLVLLKGEWLKLEIDENTEKMLAVLNDYKNKCELNFKDSNFETSLKSLENMKEETEKMLKESLDLLNQLKVDDEKWRRIKNECDSKVENLNNEIESVQKLILMNELEEKRAQVDHFVNVDLTPLFRFEVTRDSEISISDESSINNSRPTTPTVDSISPNDNHTTQQMLEKFQISPQTEIINRSTLVNQPTTLNLSAPDNISDARSPLFNAKFRTINVGKNDGPKLQNCRQTMVQHVGLSTCRNGFDEMLSRFNYSINKRTMRHIKTNACIERVDQNWKRASMPVKPQGKPPQPHEQSTSKSNRQFRHNEPRMKTQAMPTPLWNPPAVQIPSAPPAASSPRPKTRPKPRPKMEPKKMF